MLLLVLLVVTAVGAAVVEEDETATGMELAIGAGRGGEISPSLVDSKPSTSADMMDSPSLSSSLDSSCL